VIRLGRLVGRAAGHRPAKVSEHGWFNWTGTVKGDEIAMTRVAEGGQGQK